MPTEETKAAEMAETKPVSEMETAEKVEAGNVEMAKSTEAELDQVRAALKKANAEAAKYRKAAEQAEAEEAKRKEAEMTELQKVQKRAAELEERLKRVEREGLQRDIAARIGLPPALADRLKGETPEELEADAKAVLESLPKAPPKPAGLSATNPGVNGGTGETEAERRRRLIG